MCPIAVQEDKSLLNKQVFRKVRLFLFVQCIWHLFFLMPYDRARLNIRFGNGWMHLRQTSSLYTWIWTGKLRRSGLSLFGSAISHVEPVRVVPESEHLIFLNKIEEIESKVSKPHAWDLFFPILQISNLVSFYEFFSPDRWNCNEIIACVVLHRKCHLRCRRATKQQEKWSTQITDKFPTEVVASSWHSESALNQKPEWIIDTKHRVWVHFGPRWLKDENILRQNYETLFIMLIGCLITLIRLKSLCLLGSS